MPKRQAWCAPEKRRAVYRDRRRMWNDDNTPLVLIVDDDAPIRELLSRWLTAAGYETLQAPDAEMALRIMMSGSPMSCCAT